jgi:hypothetical protein
MLDVIDEVIREGTPTTIFGDFYLARATVPRMQPASMRWRTGSIIGVREESEDLSNGSVATSGGRPEGVAPDARVHASNADSRDVALDARRCVEPCRRRHDHRRRLTDSKISCDLSRAKHSGPLFARKLRYWPGGA